MLRFIGFLFGVAIAIIVLATAVDAPTRERVGAPAIAVTSALFEVFGQLKETPYVDTAESTAATPAAPSPELGFAASTAAEDEQSAGAAGTPNIATPIGGSTPPAAATRGEPQDISAPEQAASLADASGPASEKQQWQPVWQAFRSALSANGFADHLQRLTGQQYRVRRTSAWAYQVELAYVDGRRRDAVLYEIQTKTGLGVMDTQP